MSKIPMLEKFAAQSLVEHDGELIFSKERFAELIVEEMYDFMCKATDNDGAWPSSKEVKQHFGVEEPPINDVDRILQTIRTRS